MRTGSDLQNHRWRGKEHASLNICAKRRKTKGFSTQATFVGIGDLHETQWDHLERSFVLSNIVSESSMEEDGHCLYSFFIYPSDELRDVWHGLTPLFFAVTAAGAFFLIAITFIMYDRYVIRRNERMIDQAAKTNKIVASLFPSNVRDRLLEEEEAQKGESGAQTRLKSFLANDGPSKADMEMKDGEEFKTRPIADLFPETSVLYADIAGFTSWSSAREPNQVFTLLETIYRAFDEIAKVCVGRSLLCSVDMPDQIVWNLTVIIFPSSDESTKWRQSEIAMW